MTFTMNSNTKMAEINILERGHASWDDLLQISEEFPWIFVELARFYIVSVKELKELYFSGGLGVIPFNVVRQVMMSYLISEEEQ